MALGVRGSNPIWSEVDLQGNLFDDTFYLFVLENNIPYIPETVYHDPDLSVPWTQPIQFLGNGTLPVDIFFVSDRVYRLEFRQGPDQSYPLIYEVNNYIPGSGGASPVDTLAFASSNQVTNPQFALINFTSPYTFAATDPDPIHVAPGWYLELAGTGTATITQVPLDNANTNPSNAPYALQLTLNGWTTGSVFLRQRFEQNGMLWANKFVSSTITSRLQGAPQSIEATLIDSNNTVLKTVLPLTLVNESWNEFTGYGELGETTNPDTPPASYIDYKLALPSNIDIYVTSIQLVVQEVALKPSFEQDSINRQIDHTYNAAYPIVPVGTVIDYYGFLVSGDPIPHYLPCNNVEINRNDYQLLFSALTRVETVTLTSGSPTFTVANGTIYPAGYAVEGDGVPAGTTILSIATNTITLSANATSTGSSALRFFVTGNGDGATTFNTPELRGYVIAGSGLVGMLAAQGTGQKGGNSTINLSVGQLPAHTHTLTGQTGTANSIVVAAGGSAFLAASPGSTSTNSTGDGDDVSVIQLTALAIKLIRYD